MTPRAVIVAAAIALAASCSSSPPAREYEVIGQIIRINPDTQEVTLRHRDIVGFMPGMTMPFKVRDEDLLDGRTPGDLVTATLVVEETDAYLSALIKTGHAEIQDPPPAPAVTDRTLLDTGEAVPAATLVGHDGQPWSTDALKGHRTAVTFAYTRCPLPDFCPLMDRHFAEVQKTIAATPALADVRLVTVTVDPAYDTPAVLTKHAAALGADTRVWRFVTGPPADVMAFAAGFGVIAELSPQDPATVTHNLRTAVIDAEGRLVSAVSGSDWTPASLVADLTAVPAPSN